MKLNSIKLLPHTTTFITWEDGEITNHRNDRDNEHFLLSIRNYHDVYYAPNFNPITYTHTETFTTCDTSDSCITIPPKADLGLFDWDDKLTDKSVTRYDSSLDKFRKVHYSECNFVDTGFRKHYCKYEGCRSYRDAVTNEILED